MLRVGGEDVLAMASGLALLAFGVTLVRAGRQAGPSFLLGLFASLWGLQAVLIRVWVITLGEATGFALAGQSVTFALFPFLLHFAAIFPTRLRVVESRAWLPLLAAPGVALLAAVALDAEQGFLLPAGMLAFNWGWATILFGVVPFLVALTFAVARFARAYVRAEPGRTRTLLRYSTLGLLLFVSYFFAVLVGEPVEFYLSRMPLAAAYLYKAAQLACLPVVLGSIALLVVRSPRRDRLLWGAAAAVPAATAVGLDTFAGGLVGLWRLGTVALLWYAVAKCSLVDVELRLRSSAGWVAGAGLGAAVWGLSSFAVLAAFPRPGVDAGILGGTALLGLAAGVLARPALTRGVDRQFPYIRATDEYRLRRRLEVYRASLDAGLEPPQLDALARDLGLKAAERRILDRSQRPGLAGGSDVAGLLAGRYRVERSLGLGVFGRILLARDERLGGSVVLKEYQGFAGAAASEGFAREAKTLGQLEHPHIVKVEDVFRARDDLYVVLEHLPDGSLEDQLRRGGPLPLDEALRVTEHVLRALVHAHKRGVVHRDVKPSNILFRGAKAKLADFGIALDPVLDGALRASRGTPGTIGWMAPEQAAGDGAGPPADVHAVGAVLYRMLAGRHYLALDHLGEQAARRAIVRRAPALPLPGVPDDVNALLARALAKRPEDRPDAAAMLKEVTAWQRQPKARRDLGESRSLMGPTAHPAA